MSIGLYLQSRPPAPTAVLPGGAPPDPPTRFAQLSAGELRSLLEDRFIVGSSTAGNLLTAASVFKTDIAENREQHSSSLALARRHERLSPGMDEFGGELEEIKREIVESRALTIKTNNLVNALAADVKSIAKRFQGYERRLVWNSATAYAVFVALVLFAGKILFDARVDAIRAQTKDTRDLADKLEKDLKLLQTREEARTRAERRAADFFGLVQSGKRREVIDQYDEVSHMELSRTERMVFDAALERAKNELSLIAYQTGLDHVRTARWHEAEQALRDSLNYKPDAAHSPEARYQLAVTLRALGRQREAIPSLIELSEASADKEVIDDATFLLAQCQIDIEAWNDAKTTLRTFIRRFPTSPHLNDTRAKLADIQLYH